MPLIVLYDPDENERTDTIQGYPMSHVDRRIHYWAMRDGNPFQDLDVLWINRRYQDHDGVEIFHNITDVVYNNIDHMYIWSDDEVFANINGWSVDTDHGFELSNEQINRLRDFNCNNIFLAVEMTEHAVWGSNAFQRFSRIVQCVSNNIPVIYAVLKDPTGAMGGGEELRSRGQLHWWSLGNGAIRQAIENLINLNQDITQDNIQYCWISTPSTNGVHAIDSDGRNFGNIEYQEFSQWVHPFMLVLWDTYDTPVYAHEIL